MRRVLIAAIVASLAAAPPALAHTTVAPLRIEPGEEARLAFAVPNESRAPLTRVELRTGSFEVEAVEAKPGWRVARSHRRVVWNGGRIDPGEFATFSITGSAAAAGRISFRVDAGGEASVVAVDVGAARTSGNGLAKGALAAAVVAAAIAVGAFFLALGLWLRGPRDELRES